MSMAECDENSSEKIVHLVTYIMNYTMEKRLSKIPGNHGITYATFVLVDEGHTLGNALSSVINEYPGIKICAYTVPHPAENKIHFNIQTTGESAIEVLKRGFQDLEKICDHTIETFDKAYKKFKSSNDVPTEHITT